MQGTEMMTVLDAAKDIGVSRWTVYNLLKQGILPYSRPASRSIRIARRDLDAYMQTRRYNNASS